MNKTYFCGSINRYKLGGFLGAINYSNPFLSKRVLILPGQITSSPFSKVFFFFSRKWYVVIG